MESHYRLVCHPAQRALFLVSAPEPLRAKNRGLSSAAMMTALETTRPAGDTFEPLNATAIALKRLAVRHGALRQELGADRCRA